jgi:predicted Zn-dependent protease
MSYRPHLLPFIVLFLLSGLFGCNQSPTPRSSLSPKKPSTAEISNSAPTLPLDLPEPPHAQTPEDLIVESLEDVVPLGKQALHLAVQTALLGIEVTPAEEQEIGALFFNQIAQQQGDRLNQDQATVAYLTNIGNAIARSTNRSGINYTFHVIEDETVNAFVIPGGYVFLYRGILNTLENEAQLAALLGHEIGHNDAGHTLDFIKIVKAQEQLGVSDISKIIPPLTANLITYVYQESEEIEADQIGTNIAFDRCYDPHQISIFWDGINSPTSDGILKLIDLVLRTHPPSNKRAIATRQQAIDLITSDPQRQLIIGQTNYRRQQPGYCS